MTKPAESIEIFYSFAASPIGSFLNRLEEKLNTQKNQLKAIAKPDANTQNALSQLERLRSSVVDIKSVLEIFDNRKIPGILALGKKILTLFGNPLSVLFAQQITHPATYEVACFTLGLMQNLPSEFAELVPFLNPKLHFSTIALSLSPNNKGPYCFTLKKAGTQEEIDLARTIPNDLKKNNTILAKAVYDYLFKSDTPHAQQERKQLFLNTKIYHQAQEFKRARNINIIEGELEYLKNFLELILSAKHENFEQNLQQLPEQFLIEDSGSVSMAKKLDCDLSGFSLEQLEQEVTSQIAQLIHSDDEEGLKSENSVEEDPMRNLDDDDEDKSPFVEDEPLTLEALLQKKSADLQENQHLLSEIKSKKAQQEEAIAAYQNELSNHVLSDLEERIQSEKISLGNKVLEVSELISGITEEKKQFDLADIGLENSDNIQSSITLSQMYLQEHKNDPQQKYLTEQLSALSQAQDLLNHTSFSFDELEKYLLKTELKEMLNASWKEQVKKNKYDLFAAIELKIFDCMAMQNQYSQEQEHLEYLISELQNLKTLQNQLDETLQIQIKIAELNEQICQAQLFINELSLQQAIAEIRLQQIQADITLLNQISTLQTETQALALLLEELHEQRGILSPVNIEEIGLVIHEKMERAEEKFANLKLLRDDIVSKDEEGHFATYTTDAFTVLEEFPAKKENMRNQIFAKIEALEEAAESGNDLPETDLDTTSKREKQLLLDSLNQFVLEQIEFLKPKEAAGKKGAADKVRLYGELQASIILAMANENVSSRP